MIRVNDEFVITVNDCTYIAAVDKHKTDKEGKPMYKTIGYYPRLMIWHNLLTRNAKRPDRFRMIFDRRMELKHAGKKKEQAPLKIVINGTYGISKDKNNPAYDPRNANLICVNGQLLLLDLIEKLEAIPSFELIQSNTDGLIIKIHRRDFDMLDDICYAWETRSDMKLAFDYIERDMAEGCKQLCICTVRWQG